VNRATWAVRHGLKEAVISRKKRLWRRGRAGSTPGCKSHENAYSHPTTLEHGGGKDGPFVLALPTERTEAILR
jgi:hypothetical protein